MSVPMPELSLPFAVMALVAGAAVIVATGPRMVGVADRLADKTGLGEAIMGAVFVGGVTSLADIVATVTPALRGLPDLAMGNALGGVLAQTAFLALADVAYRRSNLEHATVSVPNLFQGGLLVALLGGVLVLLHGPQAAVLGVHPGTLVLFAAYAYGMKVAKEVSDEPLWRPVRTSATRAQDQEAEPAEGRSLSRLWAEFAILAVILAGAGWVLAIAGESIVEATGLGGAAVGVFMTGLSSSLAELVVSVSAVRSGALALAVGNVIGGNTFDTLLVGLGDIAFREGSLYAAVGPDQSLIAAAAVLATAILIMGLLRRERHGVANIGMESALVLVVYGLVVLALT